MRAQPKASHFVNGAYVEDTAGAVIDVVYPATGEVIARLHEWEVGEVRELAGEPENITFAIPKELRLSELD